MLKKHSVSLRGHRTSVSLEDVFWRELSGMAKAQGLSLQQLIEAIDKARTSNLCSALRVYVVETLKKNG